MMLHKPSGYITTTSDQQGRPTVMELVSDIPQRVFPVGRLDYNTTGLLLMTNDGDLANKLMHPGHKVGKTYRAKVAGVLSAAKVAKLRKGVDIGGYVTSPAKVTVVKQTERSAVADITIYEGKNRQVRKMFKAVGCPVQRAPANCFGRFVLGKAGGGPLQEADPSGN